MGLSLKTATYLLCECSRSWLKASGEGVKMHSAVWSPAMGSEKKAFGLGQHRAHCPCHCWCSCPPVAASWPLSPLQSCHSTKVTSQSACRTKRTARLSLSFSLSHSVGLINSLCIDLALWMVLLQPSHVLLSSWLHFPGSTVQETVFLSFILFQSVSNPSVDLNGYGPIAYISCNAREWQVCILMCLY